MPVEAELASALDNAEASVQAPAGTPANSGSALVKQGHGGAIRQGENWGNKGGRGNAPAEIRQKLQHELLRILPKLSEDLNAGKLDQVEYANFLARYGVGVLREMSTEQVREKLRDTLTVIRSNCDPETASRVIELMRPIWL